jgi:hypothetical protein
MEDLSLDALRDAMAHQFAQVNTISVVEATAYIDNQLDYARIVYRAAGAPFGDDDAGAGAASAHAARLRSRPAPSAADQLRGAAHAPTH